MRSTGRARSGNIDREQRAIRRPGLRYRPMEPATGVLEVGREVGG